MPLFNPETLREIKARQVPAVDRPKVLIVDDEPANLRMMATLLEENFEILQAKDGQEAWEMLDVLKEANSLACIVSDQRMPRMTGIELFERVHAVLPDVIRIIVTGFVDVESIIDSINKAEIYKFIVKPFDANDFKITVKRAAEAFAVQRRLDEYFEDLEATKETLEAANAELLAHNASFHRFVPSEFLQHLDRQNLLEVRLGDHALREMSVLFSDIVDFTKLSERMQPQENFEFLNSYLSRIGPLIRRNGGFVDKYFGDGVMALFPKSRRDALDAALDIRRELSEYNAGRARAGYVPIDVGIGLHCGALMLGTIGEQERMDTTVIADAVNVSSRLESLTRVYRVGVIVSEAITERLSDKSPYFLRPLGTVHVKGREGGINIYELFDADEPRLREHKRQTAKGFATALAAYRSGAFEEARKQFSEISNAHDGDGPAAYYRARCTALLANAPADWSGVDIFETK